MAQELGLGVTPWSPLKSGVLSGKYRRENAGKVKPDRGAWVESSLDERAYTVIDVLLRVAKELRASPAHVALAWVNGRAGVSSTIIGARTLQQLEDNLGALDVKLSSEQVAALEEASKPTLSFPAPFLENAPMFMHGGLTVKGVTAPPWPFAPKPGAPRY
jgi:aryl-alcohol dehydrogenase-like predicted oxidoreductase